MPGMDGFSVLRKLREQTQVPVLMLTAKTEQSSRILGLESGADDYLPKPFELPILLSRVQGLLRRHEWFLQEAAAQATPIAAQF